MAQISAAAQEKVFTINRWLGLNQNPDGDTKLKLGEAADMRNFKITRDGNLQRRPGTHTIVDTETAQPIKGLWHGYVQGVEMVLGACNGKLYGFYDGVSDEWGATELGTVDTSDTVSIFGFEGNAYILDGKKYRVYDGSALAEVAGYIPLVYIAIPPVGGPDNSSTIENVNRLTPKRRVWLSPDGEHATFQLPELGLVSIDYVMSTSDNEIVPVTDYTVDATAGTVTFNTAPAESVNSYEVGYTATIEDPQRYQIEGMRYAELYAGTQDTRVFLYGDGSNRCIYSGLDYNGMPRADYFPDLYEAHVGDENTPITSMIRHYSSLVCYKLESTWAISATEVTLADSLQIPGFWVTPVNKAIGNVAPGQVQLVMNNPYTLFGNDLYEWRNSSYYTSNLTRDERQAHRISDRIWSTLRSFDSAKCHCYDDNDHQEYYVCYNGEALVYNYASDAWYKYTAFPAYSMCNLKGELYIGSTDGKIKHVSYSWLNDDGTAIDAFWESGSMAFGQDYMRKYSAMLWVGIKPESDSEVQVSAQTDRSNTLTEKVVSSVLSTFSRVNFGRWSFETNRKPHMKKLKIKAKKFVFYKLIFECTSEETRCTILSADIRVRFTGYTK